MKSELNEIKEDLNEEKKELSEVEEDLDEVGQDVEEEGEEAELLEISEEEYSLEDFIEFKESIFAPIIPDSFIIEKNDVLEDYTEEDF